jgi:hypothetical protein
VEYVRNAKIPLREANVKTETKPSHLDMASEILLESDAGTGPRKRTRVSGPAGAARSYEFTCSRCHLIKPKSHIARADGPVCRDCG